MQRNIYGIECKICGKGNELSICEQCEQRRWKPGGVPRSMMWCQSSIPDGCEDNEILEYYLGPRRNRYGLMNFPGPMKRE